MPLVQDPDGRRTRCTRLDWDGMGEELNAQAVPLAEREEQPTVAAREPAPDNRAGWDAIAKAYQEETLRRPRRGPAEVVVGRCSRTTCSCSDDVRGKRALVLGCGGGQDVVALAKMGAVAVGIDLSAKQIEYARKYAACATARRTRRSSRATSRISRASMTRASIWRCRSTRCDYVERAGSRIARGGARAEAGRRARDRGAASVRRTRDRRTRRTRIVRLVLGRGTVDWTWDVRGRRDGATSGAYRRTMQEWFEMLTGAGFADRARWSSRSKATSTATTRSDSMRRLARLAAVHADHEGEETMMRTADRQLRQLHLQPLPVPGRAGRDGRGRAQRRDHGRGHRRDGAGAHHHLAGPGQSGRGRHQQGRHPPLRRQDRRSSASASATSASARCSAASSRARARSCTARCRTITHDGKGVFAGIAVADRGDALPLARHPRRTACRTCWR